jgi:maleylpyruvate isomerase
MTTEASDRRLTQTLGWMDQGTHFFENQLGSLSDEELSLPSRLPDWTRLHIVSHMARNARALTNLLRWAETGVECPMYPTLEDRRADIEAGARQPPDIARADARSEAGRFKAAVLAMPASAWTNLVRNARGHPFRASEVPWMRVREVWVHGIDLGAGATFGDVDEDVALALLEEAVASFAGRENCPSVVLLPVGAEEPALFVGPRIADPIKARGSAQALTGWVLGRTAGAGVVSPVRLPDPPPWL